MKTSKPRCANANRAQHVSLGKGAMKARFESNGPSKDDPLAQRGKVGAHTCYARAGRLAP